jgi:ABC-type branched-subunit amino acid transport system substrate-binding protein
MRAKEGAMTRTTRLLAALMLLTPAAIGQTACGDDDDEGGGAAGGGTVNVYSSLPLQGAQRLQTTAMVNGIKLALEQHDGKAGKLEVKYTSLDDSTAQAGTWIPEATSANARKVAQDDSAIAYIGEFNSGASAISIPILNEVPVAQISPSNTAVGLTSGEPGADKGEPDKYYPTGERHYLRIVPKDTIQGAALATVMKQDGCTSAYILNDKEVYGAGLAKNIESRPRSRASRSRRTRASTRRRRTSVPRRRRSRARARTASCSRGSLPTARSSCTRTWRPRRRTRSSTDRTASRTPSSSSPTRAASQPRWRAR